ncbi:MAG: hypothetical protein R3C59_11830 [Planctomycetaceae bacterium]
MFKNLFRWLRQLKGRPRSRLYKYTNRTATVLGVAYLLLIFFPSSLFAWHVQVGEFRVYSDRHIPAGIDEVIGRAVTKLETSPFYSGTETFDLYIANDAWRRTLLNPRGARAFGGALALTGNTILNRADIEKDQIHNDQPTYNQRPLHQVIAHECTHQMLARNYGLIRYLCLPTWKNEGYCEFVAGDSTIPLNDAPTLLRKANPDPPPAIRYAEYHLAVRECLVGRRMSVDDFFEDDVKFEEVLAAALAGR